MNSFINELKNEHKKLLAILVEAQEAGLVSDAGRKKLLESKKLLTGHLRKEDTKLYPELKRLSSEDKAAHKTAENFASEMNGLSGTLLDFIDRAEKAELNMEYAKELGRITAALRMRIGREEVQLYPLYEKYCG